MKRRKMLPWVVLLVAGLFSFSGPKLAKAAEERPCMLLCYVNFGYQYEEWQGNWYNKCTYRSCGWQSTNTYYCTYGCRSYKHIGEDPYRNWAGPIGGEDPAFEAHIDKDETQTGENN